MEIRLADSITHKGFQTERKPQNIDLRNLIKQLGLSTLCRHNFEHNSEA